MVSRTSASPSGAPSWLPCPCGLSGSKKQKSRRMTTWVALFILALAAMLLVSNKSGMIAGLDSTTFGYVALLLALAVFIGGGMLGGYRRRIGAMVRDAVSFHVQDLGDGDTARGPFAGQWKGVVRPLLDWTSEDR